MAKSKKHLKRRGKRGYHTTAPKDRSWDKKGGKIKEYGGVTYYYDRFDNLKKTETYPFYQNPSEVPEPTWLFVCPIDEQIALAVSTLSPDTVRHCERGDLENNSCAFIGVGCTGCNPEAKALFQQLLLNL